MTLIEELERADYLCGKDQWENLWDEHRKKYKTNVSHYEFDKICNAAIEAMAGSTVQVGSTPTPATEQQESEILVTEKECPIGEHPDGSSNG